MSTFQGTGIELIELNDTTWRSKVNDAFTTLTATQSVTANYTVDSSPPTNASQDRIIFVDTSSNAVQITLPTASSSNLGRIITLVNVGDSSNNITVTAASGSVQGITTIALTGYSTPEGVTVSYISNGTNWYSMQSPAAS